ncbi:polypeptide N-acetylgalactosaminyltransferase 15 [Octodon degus]|uniref:Polypeptide N-acetylgalactosaminyltransferase n=1 Tax=Octodon degus TaxID=10160 RepID=A0A6P6EGN3_OCTDE|nr:polypeptide N-acetylgalactosaminyltransferase 15 [Octodon degus]
MLVKKRYRPAPCRRQFPLLCLMLGCVLMLVAVLYPPPPTPHEAVTAQASKRSSEARYRLDFGDSQEWVVGAEEEEEEYGLLEDLPPFISLREDQLLVAVASPRARRNQSQGRRGGSYRLIKHLRRQSEGAPERGWGTEEEDRQVSKEEALSPLSLDSQGLNKALSSRLPLQRVLPEVRHPLQQGQLKSALSEYVAQLEGVKLLRSTKRLGTIRARMLGATRATGDVLVFMDTHCECHPGWLEPLLSRIAGDRSRVVAPVIHMIDWKTFQYRPSEELHWGVLDWKLDFFWDPLPEQERKALLSPISPIRSPVVPREVVAMDRHYFQNTGAYDPLMSLRGGENLELSFKAWLCGGSVEILPCSRVGYIYRNQEAHSPFDVEATLRNKVRIAESWLGPFKEIFYRHSPEALILKEDEKPDCTERLQLQRRLGCRTFHWFLANVYPKLYPSEHRPRFSGKLHNSGLGFCADCQAEKDILGCPLMLAPCNDSRKQQHLEHPGRKEIHFGSPQHLCLDIKQEQVVLQNCTEEGSAIHRQHWDFQENGMIVHILSGKCMEAMAQQNSKELFLSQCDGKASQLWQFDEVHPVDEQ